MNPSKKRKSAGVSGSDDLEEPDTATASPALTTGSTARQKAASGHGQVISSLFNKNPEIPNIARYV